jgi:hypothetical protein
MLNQPGRNLLRKEVLDLLLLVRHVGFHKPVGAILNRLRLEHKIEYN